MRPLALTLLIALAACSSTTSTTVVNRTVPKAQEATDLQRAFDAGLLSPAEYADQKTRLSLR